MLDLNLDTENYKAINNPNSRSVVLSLLDNMDYMDAWRILNEDKKGFSWKRLHPERKQALFD